MTDKYGDYENEGVVRDEIQARLPGNLKRACSTTTKVRDIASKESASGFKTANGEG